MTLPPGVAGPGECAGDALRGIGKTVAGQDGERMNNPLGQPGNRVLRTASGHGKVSSVHVNVHERFNPFAGRAGFRPPVIRLHVDVADAIVGRLGHRVPGYDDLPRVWAVTQPDVGDGRSVVFRSHGRGATHNGDQQLRAGNIYREGREFDGIHGLLLGRVCRIAIRSIGRRNYLCSAMAILRPFRDSTVPGRLGGRVIATAAGLPLCACNDSNRAPVVAADGRSQ